MLLRNTTAAYGWISIILHWLMAVVVLGMFALGVYMVTLNYTDDWYKSAPYIHQSVGLLLLFLFSFRLFWRVSNPLPIIFGSSIEKLLALWVHRTHYFFIFSILLSGYLIVTAGGRGIALFTWFEMPALFPIEKGREDLAGFVHMVLAWGFMAFIGLHATAALKHHFVDKDRTLLRMLGTKKGE